MKSSFTDPRQRRRHLMQAAFFALFVLAPPLDIFRLDLNLKHFILFGYNWTLGLDALLAGEASIVDSFINLLLRGLFPIILLVGIVGWLSWHYGRLYCGWLCPHFSVVEMINNLFRRASGKPTLWEQRPLPPHYADGRPLKPKRRHWFSVTFFSLSFAFVWALVLLTYLLPPKEIYGNLIHLSLTHNQTMFLSIASLVFSIDFIFARHLFCRFGCAIGLFQSFLWMANKRAQVIGFDFPRAKSCKACQTECENACPMRLKPRTIKRKMFTCTTCGQCLSACEQVQAGGPGNSGKRQSSLLQWQSGDCALPVSDNDFGHHPSIQDGCFKRLDDKPSQ